MSLLDYDYDWQEPDGTCHDCGLDLDDDPEGDHDEHHRQCWRCWRGESDDKLDADLDRIDRVSPLTEECPECAEIRVLFPSPGGRACFECKAANR